jgi:segregation and condensation protein B
VSGNERETPEADLLVSALGAVIFASDEPVATKEIAAAFGGLDEEAIVAAFHRLADLHAQSETGLRVERVAGGYRLATRPEVGAWVRDFMRQRNRARLSPAALETLAIVAYRQPVTVPEIQAIRGKDPTAALKNLVEKRLVRILGKKKVVGSPLLYGTSKQFLVHFGLDSLTELPSIEEFDEFIGALAAESPESKERGDEEPAGEAFPGLAETAESEKPREIGPTE